jgi:hypothetical protein
MQAKRTELEQDTSTLEQRKQENLELEVKIKLKKERLEQFTKRLEETKEELYREQQDLKLVQAEKIALDGHLASMRVAKGSREYNMHATQFLVRLDMYLNGIFPILIDATFRAIQLSLEKPKILKMLNSDWNTEMDTSQAGLTKATARGLFILWAGSYQKEKLKEFDGRART